MNNRIITAALVGINLSPGEEIVNTSYELSDVKDFSNILESNYFDAENKYSMIFDHVPENGKTYYVRVSCVLTSGPTAWGQRQLLSLTQRTCW